MLINILYVVKTGLMSPNHYILVTVYLNYVYITEIEVKGCVFLSLSYSVFHAKYLV